MAKLKPCPFCGGNLINYDCRAANGYRSREARFITFLKCDTCGTQTRAFAFDGNCANDRVTAEIAASKAWNRRAEDGSDRSI